jgi:hypothetical protein
MNTENLTLNNEEQEAMDQVVENEYVAEEVNSDEPKTHQMTNEELFLLQDDAYNYGEAMGAFKQKQIESEVAKKAFWKGILVAAGIGTTIAVPGWFMYFKEKRTRKALLKQVSKTTAIAAAIASGESVVHHDDKEIQLAKDLTINTFDIIEEVRKNMNEVKMKSSETIEWARELENLSRLSVTIPTQIAVEKKKKEEAAKTIKMKIADEE